MRKIRFLYLTLICLFNYACINNDTPVNGYPEDVLPEALYNKLQKEYSYISNFINSIAVVSKGDKKGAINAKGKIVLPCNYTEISDTIMGVRIVMDGNHYGLLNNKGKLSIPCQYDRIAMPVYGHAAVLQNNKWGIVDHDNNIIIQFKYDNIRYCGEEYFIAQYHGQYGISSYEDKTLINFEYDEITPSSYVDNFIFVFQNNKCGIFTTDFKKLYDPIFDRFLSSTPPSNGIITTKKDDLYGAIDCKTGKIVIPFTYLFLGDYSDNLFFAKQNMKGKYGYIDINNNIVIPFKYEDASNFSEGYAVVAVYKEKMKTVLLGTVDKDAYGVINKQDEWVIKPQFGMPGLSSYRPQFVNGLCPMGIYSNEKVGSSSFGFIDKQGKWAILPIYDDVQNFKNGVAEVSFNGKWGAINTKGDIIVDMIYDRGYPTPFYDDSFILEKGNKIYRFDLEGKLIKSW